MAEIHVEAKKKATPAWIWIVLALVVVAIIIYFAARNKTDEKSSSTNKANPTSYIQLRDSSVALV